MNKLRFFLVLFFGILVFFGCHKWGDPEFKGADWVPPDGTMQSQFWTIASQEPNNVRNIFRLHTAGAPPDSIVNYQTSQRYVRAVVVSSDEGGNYYKSMVIQDETGGVELELDVTGLYNFYPVGQKIVLYCKGLVIGDYGKLPQIGWIYNGNQVGRINSLFIDRYIQKDGLPSLKNIPKPLTNDEIDFTLDFDAKVVNKDINKLVRLENVTFEPEAIGKPIAFNDFTTEWKIYVPYKGSTQEVMVRTSNYAKFRSMIIEKAPYNLSGILTVYGTGNRATFQLLIRTKDDIEAPAPSDNIEFDFTKDPMEEGKWSTQSMLGTTKWSFRIDAMNHFGNKDYQHDTEMDDWFISPVINYPNIEDGYLHIYYKLPVLNGKFDAYQIYYTTSTSTTFNPAEWKLLGNINLPSNDFEWSNRLPLKVINANSFRIAFRYNAPDPNDETYRWYIQKVEIRNK